MSPIQEAAMEKARAGEGRNVEHVALETDATLQLASQRAPPRRSLRKGTGMHLMFLWTSL
jgi:hypothetical protein